MLKIYNTVVYNLNVFSKVVRFCRPVDASHNYVNFFEPGLEKKCLIPYANNKGADQPAHLCSLIRAFIVRCLDSILCVLVNPKFQDSSLLL